MTNRVVVCMSEEGELSDYEFEEEEESSNSSEAVDTRMVLPVCEFTDTFTPTSTPTCGEEYLALVRHQRHAFSSISAVSDDGNVILPKLKTTKTSSSIVSASQEFVDEILQEFDANWKPTHDDREALKIVELAVKEGHVESACKGLQQLDARLTSNQTSLLRSLAKQSADLKMVVIVACRFGQSDLLSIE